MLCKYSESWGCKDIAAVDGMCRPHAVLFLWLIEGPGATGDRLREHDTIAALGAPDLEQTLRGPIWDPRIRALLKGPR